METMSRPNANNNNNNNNNIDDVIETPMNLGNSNNNAEFLAPLNRGPLRNNAQVSNVRRANTESRRNNNTGRNNNNVPVTPRRVRVSPGNVPVFARNAALRQPTNQALRNANRYSHANLVGNAQTPAVAGLVEATKQRGLKDPSVKEALRTHVRSLLASRVGEERNPCRSTRHLLHEQQLLVYETAKTIAAAGKDVDARGHQISKDRGQLIWANTGGGKTLMALSILLAYWDTPRNLFVLTTLSNRKTNSPKKYIQNLKHYFPKVYRILARDNPTFKGIFKVNNSGPAQFGNTKVIFCSVEQVINMLSGSVGYVNQANHPFWGTRGSVLIMDEAHRLFEGGGSSTEDAALRLVGERFRNLSGPQLAKVHVYPLTATPASNIKQWLDMIDLVRPWDLPAANRVPPSLTSSLNTNTISSATSAYIRTRVASSVIVADTRNDRTTHACAKDKNMFSRMDRWYYAAYLYHIHTLRREHRLGNSSNNPQKLQKEILKAGMELPLSKVKAIVPKEVLQLLQADHRFINTSWVSSKLVHLAEYLWETPGKHFVYTSGSATLLAQALTMWHGAKDVTAAVLESTGANYRSRPGRLNFVVWGEKSQKGKKHETSKEVLTAAFNTEVNGQGSHIKVFIASGDEYEGTDLMALQHIHLAEPFLNPLKERQAVGRGVRFCAHTGLPPAQRRVKILRWYLEPPSRPSRQKMLSHVRTRHNNHVVNIMRNGDVEHGEHGYEYGAWKASMTTEEAKRLYNFERMIQFAAAGRSSEFQRRTQFRALAGDPC